MLQTEPTFIKDPDSPNVKQVAPNPRLCITQDHKSIYFQDGEFYTGAGTPPIEYKDVPEWFWDIVRRAYSKEVIDGYKLILPENRVKTIEEKEVEAKAKDEKKWMCEECGEIILVTKKGFHVALHVRQKKAKARKELVTVG